MRSECLYFLSLTITLMVTYSTCSFAADVQLVSVDQEGAAGALDSGTFLWDPGNQWEYRSSPVTDDGVVFFLSAAALEPSQDTNSDVVDLYRSAEPGAAVVDLPSSIATGTCYFADISSAGTSYYAFREITYPALEEYIVKNGVRESLAVHNSDIADADLAAAGGAVVFTRREDDGFLHLWHRTLGVETAPATDLFPDAGADIEDPSVSADGDKIVFSSMADRTIVAGDTNSAPDVFLYNMTDGTASLISRRPEEQTVSDSQDPSISDDGNVICFVSSDGGIVAGDTNGKNDVFIWENGVLSRVSLSTEGAEADADCLSPDINADGRFVVFTSSANTLVPGVGNGFRQVYLFDRADGQLQALSLTSAGEAADADCLEPTISPSGRYVTFVSNTSNLSELADGSYYQVYRVDRGPAFANVAPAVEDVTFIGEAGQNLELTLTATDADDDALSFVVEEQPYMGTLRDVEGNLISIGTAYPATSFPWTYTPNDATAFADSFMFRATDGVEQSVIAEATVLMKTQGAGTITRVSVSADGEQATDDSWPVDRPGLSMSADGTAVVFSSLAGLVPADDDILQSDIYYRNTSSTNVTSLVSGSVSRFYNAYACSISGDGARVFYYSSAEGGLLVEHRIATGEETVIASGVADEPPAVSYDGSRICYVQDGDVYLYDTSSGTTREISITATGESANAQCAMPAMSSDGHVVAFVSSATNLAGNSEGVQSVFLYYVEYGETHLVSVDALGAPISDAERPSLSRTGKHLVFSGAAGDVYHRNLETGQVTKIAADALNPVLSANGQYAYYVKPGQNGFDQAYRVDLSLHDSQPQLVSHTPGVAESNGHAYLGSLSANGQFVAFASDAEDLVSGDTNAKRDIFVNDLGQSENVAPTADLQQVAAQEDILLEQVALSYTDPEDNDVLVDIVTTPSHAAVFDILPRRLSQPVSVNYKSQQDYYGEDSFSYRVGDGISWSEVQTVQVFVEEINDIPEWTGLPEGQAVDEGAEIRIDLMHFADDPDLQNAAPYTDSLHFNVVEPAGLDWMMIENDTELVIRPTFDIADKVNQTVAFDVQLSVQDSRDPAVVLAPATVRVTVQDVDRPPVVENVAITPEQPTSAEVLTALVTAADPDGDELAIAYRWTRNGEIVVALVDQSVPWNETRKDETWTVSVQAQAAGLSTDWKVSAPVTIRNAPPVALDANRQVVENESVAVDLAALVSDADPDDELAFSVGEAAHGTVSLADGIMTYTSTWEELSEGEEQTDTITYEVSDGAATVTGTIHVLTQGVNDPPQLTIVQDLVMPEGAVDGSISWLQDGTGMITVTDPDSPPEALRVAVELLPEKGTLTTVDGTEVTEHAEYSLDAFPLIYTPNSNATGLDAVFLVANDGKGTSETQAVAVFLAELAVTLHFERGWNAFSLPMIPNEDGNPDILLVDDLTGEKVYAGTIWHWDHAAGKLQPAQRLEALTGYLVFCPAAADLTVKGLRAPTQKEYSAGLHVLGPGGYLDALDLEIAGNVEEPGKPLVWTFTDGKFRPVPDGLARGSAYWIYLPQTQALDLETDAFLAP